MLMDSWKQYRSGSHSVSPSGREAGPDRPDRQRGNFSFLTWSFFLASFLTAAEAAAGATRSAPDDVTGGGNHAQVQGQEAQASPPHDVMAATIEAPSYVLPISELNGGNHADYSGSVGHDPVLVTDQFPGSLSASAAGAAAIGSLWGVSEIFTYASEPVSMSHGPQVADLPPTVPGITVDTTNGPNPINTIAGAIDHTLAPIVEIATQTVSNTLTSTITVLDHTLDTVTTTLSSVLCGEPLPLSGLLGSASQDIGVVLSTLDATGQAVPQVIAAVEHLPSSILTTVPQIIDQTVGSISPVISQEFGASSAISSSLNLVSDVAVSGLHASVHAHVTAVGSAEAVLPVAATLPVEHIIPPVADATHDVAQALAAPDSVLSAIGASANGSLTFGAETSGAGTPANTSLTTTPYTQYNIAIQHDLTEPAHSTVSDTGGITTIISDAIGIGHASTENHSATPDHQSDVSHLLPVHTDAVHHVSGLIG